jgi:hypothetical protein
MRVSFIECRKSSDQLQLESIEPTVYSLGFHYFWFIKTSTLIALALIFARPTRSLSVALREQKMIRLMLCS